MFGRRFFFLTGLLALIAILLSGKRPKNGKDEKPRQWPGRNNTVLFLSNSEHGLANVLLAASHAILVEHGDLEVHFASFGKLAKHVSKFLNLP